MRGARNSRAFVGDGMSSVRVHVMAVGCESCSIAIAKFDDSFTLMTVPVDHVFEEIAGLSEDFPMDREIRLILAIS